VVSNNGGTSISDRKQPGILFKFSVAVPVAIALSVFALIVTIWYYLFPDHRTGISFLVALFGVLGVVYSGYYVATSLKESIYRDRLHRSFRFTQELNSCELAEIRIFIEKDVAGGLKAAEFHDRVINKPQVHIAVNSLLGLFEDIAIAVQEEYADETTLYRSLSFMIPWCFQNFSPYIHEERRIFKDDKLFFEFEKVAGAWRENKSAVTGKPINSG